MLRLTKTFQRPPEVLSKTVFEAGTFLLEAFHSPGRLAWSRVAIPGCWRELGGQLREETPFLLGNAVYRRSHLQAFRAAEALATQLTSSTTQPAFILVEDIGQ